MIPKRRRLRTTLTQTRECVTSVQNHSNERDEGSVPAADLMWMVRIQYYFRRLTVVLSVQEGSAALRMIPKDKPKGYKFSG